MECVFYEGCRFNMKCACPKGIVADVKIFLSERM